MTARLAFALLVGAGCSVFPDKAVLPSGAGGTATAGGTTTTVVGGTATAGDSGRGGASASGGLTSGGGSLMSLGGADSADGGQGGSLEPTNGGAAGAGASDAGAGISSGGNAQGGNVTTNTGGQLGTGGGCAGLSASTLTAAADATISEADPKGNLGTDARLSVSGVSGAHLHALITFTLNPLPASGRLESARLRITLQSVSSATPHTLSVFALAHSFDESKVSWERPDAGSKWTILGGDTALTPSASSAGQTAASGTVLEFDVTADVRAALAGSATLYGWLLSANETEELVELASREAALASDRPQLVLNVCP